jgi:serine/threonine protein phosphatase PrpC
MKRILQYNGRISQYFDEESRSFIGPKRIWLKNSDIPGLAMTRSFGDLIAHSVGVIAEPEIGVYDYTGNEKFVIVASDGVWEFIDSEESVHIVKKFYENGMDACGAVNALVKEAYRRWRREEDIIDDITALVVFFD